MPRAPPKGRTPQLAAGGGVRDPGDPFQQREPRNSVLEDELGTSGTPRQSEPCNSQLALKEEVRQPDPRRGELEFPRRSRIWSFGRPANSRTSQAPPAASRQVEALERGIGAWLEPRPRARSGCRQAPPPSFRTRAPRGAPGTRGALLENFGAEAPVPTPALTCAAITRCLSAIRLHFLHWQSRHMQKRLWPLSGDACLQAPRAPWQPRRLLLETAPMPDAPEPELPPPPPPPGGPERRPGRFAEAPGRALRWCPLGLRGLRRCGGLAIRIVVGHGAPKEKRRLSGGCKGVTRLTARWRGGGAGRVAVLQPEVQPDWRGRDS